MPPISITILLMAALVTVATSGDGFLSVRRKEATATLDQGVSNGLFSDFGSRFGQGTDEDSLFGGKLQHMSPMAYAVKKCETDVDFIQILDSELNQNAVQWQYTKRMAQLMVDNFTLGVDNTHMGLLNFGGETVQVLELTDPAAQDNTKAKETIMELTQLPGESLLDDAVSAAAQLLAAARDMPKVLAVVSDFATPVDISSLVATMEQLRETTNFVSIAVVMGDGIIGNETGAQAVQAITGCSNINDGLCTNLIRADFTYPSIMIATSESRAILCRALLTTA